MSPSRRACLCQPESYERCACVRAASCAVRELRSAQLAPTGLHGDPHKRHCVLSRGIICQGPEALRRSNAPGLASNTKRMELFLPRPGQRAQLQAHRAVHPTDRD